MAKAKAAKKDACAQCGNVYMDDSVFCRKCGTKRQDTCAQCGNVYMDDSVFCRKCGTKRQGGAKTGKRDEDEGKKRPKKAPKAKKAKAAPTKAAENQEAVEEKAKEVAEEPRRDSDEVQAEEAAEEAVEEAPASAAKPRRSKANRLKEALDEEGEEEEEKERKGVVYLGHIPHGFFEPQMRKYFSQFGQVTRMRLARSRKTGGSKGYAFIEFKEESVAKIVASTMNKYLMFDKSLVCEFLPKEKCHKKLFAGWQRPPKDLRKERREKEMLQSSDRPMVEVNSLSVPQLTEQQVSRRERQKRKLKEKLASLEVDFDLDAVLNEGGTADDEAEEAEVEEPPATKKRPKKKLRPHSEVPAKRASTKPETWAALSRVQEVAYQKLSRVLLRLKDTSLFFHLPAQEHWHDGHADWHAAESLTSVSAYDLQPRGKLVQKGEDWNSREFLRELNRQARRSDPPALQKITSGLIQTMCFWGERDGASLGAHSVATEWQDKVEMAGQVSFGMEGDAPERTGAVFLEDGWHAAQRISIVCGSLVRGSCQRQQKSSESGTLVGGGSEQGEAFELKSAGAAKARTGGSRGSAFSFLHCLTRQGDTARTFAAGPPCCHHDLLLTEAVGAFGTRRADLTLALAALLALGSTAFLQAPRTFEGHRDGPGVHHSRRRLLDLSAGVLLLPAEDAGALGVAFDYRTLEEIEPPSRKPVGDVTSEKAQKAIGLLKECRQKMLTLLKKLPEDPQVDFTPYFEPPIGEIREALNDIYDLFDQDTRRDAERVGRIMLAARYNILGASEGENKMKPDKASRGIERLIPEEQVKFNNRMVDFIRAADRLLLYVA
ncbi:nifk [Symbiodinium natans]|uniref:Nifk protein n=1 Tax=Symbiodinium natans TaxID=878477 RepID=A0A812KL99_9DINO|nr:nifk [Symbiodinium natans]